MWARLLMYAAPAAALCCPFASHTMQADCQSWARWHAFRFTLKTTCGTVLGHTSAAVGMLKGTPYGGVSDRTMICTTASSGTLAEASVEESVRS